jgi:hypothetical protein
VVGTGQPLPRGGDPPFFGSPFRERKAYFRDRGQRKTTQAVSAALLCYMCTALRHALSERQHNDTASLAPMAGRTNIATRHMLLRRCFRDSFRVAISHMPSGRPLSTWYILCCAGVNCCYRLAPSRSGLPVGGPVAHVDVARHPPSTVSTTRAATWDSMTDPSDNNHLVRGQTATLP